MDFFWCKILFPKKAETPIFHQTYGIFWMLAKGRKADIDPSAWKAVEGDCWDEVMCSKYSFL